MSSTRTALQRRWADLGSGVTLPGALGVELIGRYQEPHRHYHTDRHLLAVLEALDELSAPERPSIETRLAAWFHDAVYEGAAGDDEEASARLAEERLAGVGLEPNRVARVASMVRCTAHHLDPDIVPDEETAGFLDADLSILAAEPSVYDAYCAGVRREHPDVADDRFTAGRLAVVTALLARPRLYLSERGFQRYESRARDNLRREQAALSAQAGGGARPA
jgi:predicted metal-dependent HD superfamily phosphohydrolase